MTLVDEDQKSRLAELGFGSVRRGSNDPQRARLAELGFDSKGDTARTKVLAQVDAIVEAEGTFEALVAVFNNVDRVGDRIMPGAFSKSLEDWRKSGQLIPIVWSHEISDPHMVIGSADPALSHETAEGLVLVGKLIIGSSAVASHVRDLLRDKSIGGWSFSYKVIRERRANKDVTELLELDLLEAGPTVAPANSSTRTISVKGENVGPPEGPKTPSHEELEERLLREGIVVIDNEVYQRHRDEFEVLLGARRNGDRGKSTGLTEGRYRDGCMRRLTESMLG